MLVAAAGSPQGGASVVLYLRYADAVSAKDAHVYAAALGAGSRYLITLDRPLATRVNALRGHVEALTPGAFIAEVLRGRADR